MSFFRNIFNQIFGPTFVEVDLAKARIVSSDNTFQLVDRQGFIVGTYSRRRDAVRGATRRGLVIA